MLCNEVIDVIESSYPKGYALGWDNVGLLAGRDDKRVERIYVALDATDEVIQEAVRIRADLLVTHHPLIFGGMKRITNQDFIGRRILELVRHDISYYAMHTNYDILRMGILAADQLGLKHQDVLEITHEEGRTSNLMPAEEDGRRDTLQAERKGIGRIGQWETEITLRQCCEEVKQAFQLDSVRVFGSLEHRVRTIAICPGSGKSVIEAALWKQADVLITGDIGHHEGIDAVSQQMAVIDAGHYGIEYIFIEDMRRYLLDRLQGTEKIEIITEPVRHPFLNV